GRLMEEDPPEPRTLRGDLPEALSRTIHRAIARDPAHRFADAGEFADALERVFKNKGASTGAAATPRSSCGNTTIILDAPPPRTWAPERRIAVAMMVDLGGAKATVAASDALRTLIGEDVSIERAEGGRVLLTIGRTRTDGDELIRAVRGALVATGVVT